MRCVCIVAAALACTPAFAIEPDAGRGEKLFHSQKCTECHATSGQRKGATPGLGGRFARNYSPAGIAARMWTHAPVMWAAMEKKGIDRPVLTREQAADIFAFFHAARYFERPGDPAYGKQVFEEKQCGRCHSVTRRVVGPGLPVAFWQSLSDPVSLVHRMWNHAPHMKEAIAQHKLSWPEFTSQEMAHLVAYLQTLNRKRAYNHTLAASTGGQQLIEKHGCVRCHRGEAMAFDRRLRDRTLTEIAASMWNHAPKMRQGPNFIPEEEMRRIVWHIWGAQFANPRGIAKDGEQIFAEKRCVVCHTDRSSGAPTLDQLTGEYSAVGMVAVLWKHGPSMWRAMQAKGIAWPAMAPLELADIAVYLNSLGE
jgi:mono/diheme cytochrome c family protein